MMKNIFPLMLVLGLMLVSAVQAAAPADTLTHGLLPAPNRYLDYPAIASDSSVHAIIENPAGVTDKWEVETRQGTGEFVQDILDGRPRVVNYLAYPVNYGCIPRTTGGDGDALDIVVLGPALARGAVVPVRIIGALQLEDSGEQDDKLIAVLPDGPFASVTTMAELNAQYAGVTLILETWFTNYKGPGRTAGTSFVEATEAHALLLEAITAFQHRAGGSNERLPR